MQDRGDGASERQDVVAGPASTPLARARPGHPKCRRAPNRESTQGVAQDGRARHKRHKRCRRYGSITLPQPPRRIVFAEGRPGTIDGLTEYLWPRCVAGCGRYSCGLYRYGVYSYGVYGYGLYSYGLCSYCLYCSAYSPAHGHGLYMAYILIAYTFMAFIVKHSYGYGLCSYGLYDYGLYRCGLYSLWPT